MSVASCYWKALLIPLQVLERGFGHFSASQLGFHYHGVTDGNSSGSGTPRNKYNGVEKRPAIPYIMEHQRVPRMDVILRIEPITASTSQ